jgi:hypothetical protein
MSKNMRGIDILKYLFFTVVGYLVLYGALSEAPSACL